MNSNVLATAERIKNSFSRLNGPFSISDVSAKSGLSLRESEVGLQYLVSEYRGHLAATSKGELIFMFPNGFTKPWEKTEALERALNKAKKFLLGIAKFVVRAWISIVMIGYVVVFALILLGLLAAKKSDREDDRRDSGSNMFFAVLLRLIADSLFWTFHPLSPYSSDYDRSQSKKRRKHDVPFYERVNRYFFGPEAPPPDPAELQKKMTALIRAKRGRIGVTDVMRVTGLPPHEADPLLAKLMLDYDGEVSVSEEGSLVYTFREIRKTVENTFFPEPTPIWSKREKLAPHTGNDAGSDTLITCLNGFNLMMSSIAISQGWTLEKLAMLIRPQFEPLVHSGSGLFSQVPLVLGLVPFSFSLVLFLLPISRFVSRPKRKRAIERENGRRGLLYAILNHFRGAGLKEELIKSAWEKYAEAKVDEKALLKEVVRFGGDVEISEQGDVSYRFKHIENELRTLTRERTMASDEEKNMGSVVFSSAT